MVIFHSYVKLPEDMYGFVPSLEKGGDHLIFS